MRSLATWGHEHFSERGFSSLPTLCTHKADLFLFFIALLVTNPDNSITGIALDLEEQAQAQIPENVERLILSDKGFCLQKSLYV